MRRRRAADRPACSPAQTVRPRPTSRTVPEIPSHPDAENAGPPRPWCSSDRNTPLAVLPLAPPHTVPPPRTDPGHDVPRSRSTPRDPLAPKDADPSSVVTGEVDPDDRVLTVRLTANGLATSRRSCPTEEFEITRLCSDCRCGRVSLRVRSETWQTPGRLSIARVRSIRHCFPRYRIRPAAEATILLRSI